VARTMVRRSAIGLGTAAGVLLATGAPATAAPAELGDAVEVPARLTPDQARRLVAAVYRLQTGRAGGDWEAFISVAGEDGTPLPAVEDSPDTVVEAYSVNKIAVAVAVLDKVDRGLLRLDQTVPLTADIVSFDGDGLYGLDSAYPSTLTLGHVMAAMLTVSDNTAVRLCGLVCPALELNQILVDKGFPHTQVTPVANPNRFFLGRTTPRETHDILQKLVLGELLSEASTTYLLGALRATSAFTDGLRLRLMTPERIRVATKAGWFVDGRNEAGIIFDSTGRARLTYAMFARGAGFPDDFSANHPLVQARVGMGRPFFSIAESMAATTRVAVPVRPAPVLRPTNGG
jgi:beta-lactamase class A